MLTQEKLLKKLFENYYKKKVKTTGIEFFKEIGCAIYKLHHNRGRPILHFNRSRVEAVRIHGCHGS